MESSSILELKKTAHHGDKPKIEKAAKTVFPKSGRKTLADISNLQPQMRMSNQNEKPQNIPIDVKQYIAKLEKENMTLMKLLGERTKIIELTGTEIQKLKANMMKMQQQNQQLAQSNSQMLAELNSGKDRLKALQHELGCKNGVLKAMKLEAENKSGVEKCQKLNNEVKPINYEEPQDSLKEDKVGNEPKNTKRRRMSKSLGPSKQVQSQNNAESKKVSVRRQSARFKHDEIKSKDDLLETDDSKISTTEPSNDPVLENDTTATSTRTVDQDKSEVETCQNLNNEVKPINCEETGDPSKEEKVISEPENTKRRRTSKSLGPSKQVQSKYNAESKRQSARFKRDEAKPKEDMLEIDDSKISTCQPIQEISSTSTSTLPDNVESNIASRDEPSESHRFSLNRPLRQAAKKVQCYKEIPINVKMRRSE